MLLIPFDSVLPPCSVTLILPNPRALSRTVPPGPSVGGRTSQPERSLLGGAVDSLQGVPALCSQ